jgi:hypothetical protein
MEGTPDLAHTPLQLGEVPGERRVGRPTTTPEQRALSDERYRQMMELIDAIPQDAREPRFQIYEAHDTRDAKVTSQPCARVTLAEWKEHQLGDRELLASYIKENLGEGRFIIEAYDPLGSRLAKIPPIIVTAGDPDMEILEPRRNRRRSRDYDDDEDDDFDDPVERREQRANLADTIQATVRNAQANAEVTARQSTDLFSMMLLTQQKSEESRREEDRKREERRIQEEQRREDRIREERRLDEERRREEAKREHEDRIRRETEEREERRREEDRRREEERRKDEDRRREHEARITAENKRLELIVGLVPVLKELFKKDTSVTDTLLPLLTNKKEDPVTLMLMNKMFEKQDKMDMSQVFLQQFQTMLTAGQQLNQQQLASMLEFSGKFNQQVMERALKMMLDSPHGKTEEGRSMLEKVISAVQGAAEIVKTIVPLQQPQRPLAPPNQQRSRAVVQHGPQAQDQRQATPAQQAPEQAPVDAQPLTAEQLAEIEAQTPRGTLGVLGGLMAMQLHEAGHQPLRQVEIQSVVQHILNEMPLDLRVAVLNGDQMGVFKLVQPVLGQSPELTQWIRSEGVVQWLQGYVPQLAPHIEAVWGPADAQRQQLEAYYAQAAQEAPQQQPAPEAAQGAPEVLEAPEAPEASPAVQEAAPEQAMASPEGQSPREAAPLPGPGSEPATATSHLDNDV